MQNMFIDTFGVNLQIHSNTANLGFWLQSPIKGLESPEYRVNTYNKPGEDGAVLSSQFYGARLVSLAGRLVGSTPAIYEANRQAFALAAAISKDSLGYPIAKRVTFTTLAGTTYYFDGYFDKPVYAYEHVNSTHFLINIVAPDPYLYITNNSSVIITRAIGGGAIVPFIVPVTLAPSSGGTATVVNNGNSISYPVVQLIGPLTNPYVFNATASKTMLLNYTVNSGDTVTIDMKQKTIMLNGTTPILNYKTDDSEWWGLLPGTNNISLSTASTADTGSVLITYNHSYLGI